MNDQREKGSPTYRRKSSHAKGKKMPGHYGGWPSERGRKKGKILVDQWHDADLSVPTAWLLQKVRISTALSSSSEL